MQRGLVTIAAVLMVVLSSCSGDAPETERGWVVDGDDPARPPAGGERSVPRRCRGDGRSRGTARWSSRATACCIGTPWRPCPPSVRGPAPARPLLRTPPIADELEAQLDRFETVNVLLSDLYGYPSSWPAASLCRLRGVERRRFSRSSTTRSSRGRWLSHRIASSSSPGTNPTSHCSGTAPSTSTPTLWLETEAIIRDTYPDALIGGPSYASYDSDAITAFLDRCAEARCQLDYLIWHGFQFDIPSLRADIDESNELITGDDLRRTRHQGAVDQRVPAGDTRSPPG